MLPTAVRLVEVGPRDGLQNEPSMVDLAHRQKLIAALTNAGLKTIEAGSFVSPARVPAMAKSAELFQRIQNGGADYLALTPNRRGLDAAVAVGVRHVAVLASASETFSQRNTNCSIEDGLQRCREICLAAQGTDVRVRGYVSCAAGCPFEGGIEHAQVVRVAGELLAAGCYEVSLADTIGVGTPGAIARLLDQLLKSIAPERLAVHFHDTWGQALANILIALEHGITVVDSSVAGLGGCPYAPGASGNAATEDVLYMLQGMNIETGVNLDLVAQAGLEICAVLGREPASRALLAWRAAHAQSDSM